MKHTQAIKAITYYINHALDRISDLGWSAAHTNPKIAKESRDEITSIQKQINELESSKTFLINNS